MKNARAVCFGLLLTACGSSFTSASVVNSFRVLGVSADFPELHPGDTTGFHALVTDPTRPGQNNTLVWLGCDPDPLDLGRSACSNLGNLQNAATLASQVDGGNLVLPTGMHTVGFDDLAAYQAPTDTFAQIPVGDVRRQIGSIADTLVVGAAGDLSINATDAERAAFFGQVEKGTIPSVLVINRLIISEEAQLNHNPVAGPLRVDGTPLPDGGTFRSALGDGPALELTAPDSSFETYSEYPPSGPVLQTQERLVVAFFSTVGDFTYDRVALRSGTPLNFVSPDGSTAHPVPKDRTGTMWAVLRDTRGGMSWTQYPVFLCDPTLPAPTFTTLSPASGPANTALTLAGQNLDQVLDVVLGGSALGAQAYSPAFGTFKGFVPTLPSGDYPVTVRAKDCHDYATGLTFHIP